MGFHNWMGCFHREWFCHVAPAFPNNPKEDEIEVMLTDAFQGDLSNVLDLSFCRLKIVEEVSSLFLSLGRLWFSNEVDLKEAQYSEEVRHVV